jgi:hypothetical protein
MLLPLAALWLQAGHAAAQLPRIQCHHLGDRDAAATARLQAPGLPVTSAWPHRPSQGPGSAKVGMGSAGFLSGSSSRFLLLLPGQWLFGAALGYRAPSPLPPIWWPRIKEAGVPGSQLVARLIWGGPAYGSLDGTSHCQVAPQKAICSAWDAGFLPQL